MISTSLSNPKEFGYVSVVVVFDYIGLNEIAYLRSIHTSMSEVIERGEFIVVLNGCTIQATEEFFACLKEFLHTAVVLKLVHQHPHEVASFVGTEYAKGDFVLELDYQLEVTTAVLGEMISKMKAGHDIVSLVPHKNSSFVSNLFYKLLNTNAVLPHSFGTEYGRFVTRRAVNAMMQLRHRTKYRKLLYAYTGFSRTVVSTEIVPLVQPHQTGRKLQFAGDVLITYTSVVLKATIALALAFMLVSAAGGGYALTMYLLKNTVIEGWTTLMLFVSFGLSGVFLILAMMVKYLELILRETQAAPLYVIDSVDIVSQGQVHPHV